MSVTSLLYVKEGDKDRQVLPIGCLITLLPFSKYGVLLIYNLFDFHGILMYIFCFPNGCNTAPIQTFIPIRKSLKYNN